MLWIVAPLLVCFPKCGGVAAGVLWAWGVDPPSALALVRATRSGFGHSLSRRDDLEMRCMVQS